MKCFIAVMLILLNFVEFGAFASPNAIESSDIRTVVSISGNSAKELRKALKNADFQTSEKEGEKEISAFDLTCNTTPVNSLEDLVYQSTECSGTDSGEKTVRTSGADANTLYHALPKSLESTQRGAFVKFVKEISCRKKSDEFLCELRI
jgi:hypothetical protein